MRSRRTILATRSAVQRRHFVLQLAAGVSLEAAEAVQHAALADELGTWARQQWGIWDQAKDYWVRSYKTNNKGKARVLAIETEARANLMAATMRDRSGRDLRVRRIS